MTFISSPLTGVNPPGPSVLFALACHSTAQSHTCLIRSREEALPVPACASGLSGLCWAQIGISSSVGVLTYDEGKRETMI